MKILLTTLKIIFTDIIEFTTANKEVFFFAFIIFAFITGMAVNPTLTVEVIGYILSAVMIVGVVGIIGMYIASAYTRAKKKLKIN